MTQARKKNINLKQFVIHDHDEPVTRLPSVDVPAHMKVPGRWTGFFGRHANDMIREAMSKAEEERKECAVFSVKVCGDPFIGRRAVSEADLKKAAVLQLYRGRVTSSLLDLIWQIIKPRWAQGGDPVDLIGQDAERVNRLWKDRRFSHLKVIVWPAILPDGTPVGLGALRGPDVDYTVESMNYDGEPPVLIFRR